MEFYRAYARPSHQDNDHLRVFRFDVANDVKVEYLKALKDACKVLAGPKPPRPTHCPRCGLLNAIFTSNLCYKAGYAGTWNMVCFSCRKVHFPPQPGPTDQGLQQIEAIRARDHAAYLERKAQKAKQRAKACAKQRKPDTDDEGTELAARPFGILNNAVEMLPDANIVKEDHKRDIKSVARSSTNYQMKGRQATAGNSKGTADNPRTVELVFWAEHQEPLVQQVPVQFEYELFLYEFPAFKSLRGVCAFERYSFEASLWCDLPWNTSPIYIAPEDRVVFVRSWGVKCRGFGRQLDLYQRMHGLALSPALGIRATINIPPARHNWLVIWGPHRPEPEIHLVDLSMAAGLDNDARLALPWAHLIADAPFLLVWRETETGWAAVGAGISSGVLEAPLTLVAHPSAEFLMGSGEAIAWLEEWRLGGGPRSRATTPTETKEGPAKRVRSRPAEVEASRCSASPGARSDNVQPRNYPESVSSDAPSDDVVMVDEWHAPSPLAPVIQHERVLPESGSSHDAAAHAPARSPSTASDDKVEVVEGPAPRAALAPPPLAPVIHHERALPESGSSHNAAAHAPARSPSTVSDDEVEVVEGPDARVAPAPPPLAPDAPHAAARSPSTASDDEVEVVEGPDARVALAPPPLAPVIQHERALPESGSSHDAAPHAAARSPSTASDDEVEIVEGPAPRAALAPPPLAPVIHHERALPESGSSHDIAHAPKHRASPTSDIAMGRIDSTSCALPGAPLKNNEGPKGSEPETRLAASRDVGRPSKRPASPLSDNEMEIVEAVALEHGRPHPHKKVRISAASDIDKNVGVVAGPNPPGPSGLSSSNACHGASAQGPSVSERTPLADDDIVWIERPSDELKRAFMKKADSSAPAGPSAGAYGPSTANIPASPRRDDSDDEVEFVDSASVVPKRRVSNVNGRQFINMT